MPHLIVGGRKVKNVPPEIVEVPLIVEVLLAIQVKKLPEGVKNYSMGDILITVIPPFNGSGWHMSMSRVARIPSWREISYARDQLLPPDTAIVIMLPPGKLMLENENFVVQLHQIVGKSKGERH